jgi:hypothetical protein
MKKLLLILSVYFFSFLSLSGEDYFIDIYNNQTVTTCRGAVLPTWLCFDAFGRRTYCNNETYTVTFYSGTPGLPFRISFLPLINAGYPTTNSFQTEAGSDFLRIYDGPDTTSFLLANLSGAIADPFYYTSNSGYLTIKFTSDASFTDYGWYAIVGCEPQSCDGNPPSNNDCESAPLICDIDGYCGNTSGWYAPDKYMQIASDYSGPFCGTIENNGWIRFIPTETYATLRIISSNCEAFDAGIQAMLFASTDCNTFSAVSTCASQSGISGEFSISNTVPLTIGTTYYLMIDGYAGNTCDYKVNVISGVRVLEIVGPPQVCTGSTATLTLTGADPGATFSWEPASAIIGTTTDSIITAAPNGTTIYTCTVTSSGECSVKNKSFVLSETDKRPVSVNVSASADPACQGSLVTFTATPVMGGSSPVYEWYLNGDPVGTNSPTYSTSTLSSGSHEVYVILNSNDTCIIGPSEATSAILPVTVLSSAVSVSITASANPVCSSVSVTFTAIPVNGGSSPSFQWFRNGTAIPGATGITYTTSSLANGNTIRVRMVSNSSCRAVTSAFSNTITMSVLPLPAVSATYLLSECPDAVGYSASLNANNPSPGSGQWTIISGQGSLSSTTNPDCSISGLSTSGLTTVVKWEVTGANGCRDSVLLNIAANAINNDEISVYAPFYCITCPLKDGNKYYYYDPDGKLAAIIQDVADGNSMGLVEVCVYLDYDVSTVPTASDVETVTDTSGFDMPFLPRHWTINVPVPGDVIATLFITDQESQALRSRAVSTPYAFNTTPELVYDQYNNGVASYVSPGTPDANTNDPGMVAYTPPVNPYWGFSFLTSGFSTTHLHPIPTLNPPLPIELISFSANPDEQHIVLEWITASERNNDYFVIERSTDALIFNEIGRINSIGNSTTLLSYRHEDHDVLQGVRYYYRIKQVDFDGTYANSEIVSAILSIRKDIIVGPFIPNPATLTTLLNVVTSNPQKVIFKLFALNGERLISEKYDLQQGNNEINIDMGRIEPGTYFGQLHTAEGVFIRKLIKVK